MWNAPRVADRGGMEGKGRGLGREVILLRAQLKEVRGLPRVTARSSTRVVRLSTPDVERTRVADREGGGGEGKRRINQSEHKQRKF